jgi:hypothetical protein
LNNANNLNININQNRYSYNNCEISNPSALCITASDALQPEKSRTIYSGARAEWDRAFICIRNGALLAAAAGLNSISPDLIGSGLKALE